MGKIAFLFAGQGAQYPGMGKSLWDISDGVKALYETADKFRKNTAVQCFEGTKEELCITSNTQPCLFCTDLASALVLKENGIIAQGVAGFSLGELVALTFAGAFTQEDGFSLVCKRGELMQKSAEKNHGSMVAVLKLNNEIVEGICKEFKKIYPVNYNSDGQLVVAGDISEMDSFCERIAENGGRAKKLAVGGGFHSPFMDEASVEFAEYLKNVEMQTPEIPVYGNYNAQPYDENGKGILAKQICNPVRWKDTIENMVADGFTTFIEVGPGKTLSGLVKRISPQSTVYRVEDEKTLNEVLEKLNLR